MSKSLLFCAIAAIVTVLSIHAPAVAQADDVKWWNLRDRIILQDQRALQWRELKASESVLTSAPVPSGWFAGAFLSGNTIARLLSNQAGTKLEFVNVKDFEDLTVELRSLSVKMQVGAPEVEVDAIASSARRKLSLDLKASGLLG